MENSIRLSDPSPADHTPRTSLATRARAAGIHLSISLIVTAAVFAAMISLWYPWPVFLAAGAPELLLLVSVCDVVLGPALTFVAFRPGKKGLKFDLAVIAILQLAALGYGVHTVHVARPVFNVFAVDRFELVSEADIEAEQLSRAAPAYRVLSQTGPRLVAARPPTDAQARSTLLMASATQGIDLRHLPQHYVDYAEVRVSGLAKSLPLSRLDEYNEPARVASVLAPFGRSPESLRYYPLRGVKRDLTVIVDGKSGDILGTVNLAPWPR